MDSQDPAMDLPKVALVRISKVGDGAVDLQQPDAAAVAAAAFPEKEEREDPCMTPRRLDEEERPSVCPPAPSKPRLEKRKRDPPPQGFFSVPPDLGLVFVPLSEQPRKIIRAG